MQLRTLTKTEAKAEFEDYLHLSEPNFNNLDKSYHEIRIKLLKAAEKHNDLQKYQFDFEFGLDVYKIFNNIKKFGLFYASNYDFWRYICVKVVPDIVEKRHGTHPSYFYAKNLRLYISTLWWYIHLSWQGTTKNTYQVLKDNNTDTILQLVERPGKKGIYIEITRCIMLYYSKLNRNQRTIIVDNKKVSTFRQIMILYLAKILVINPFFHEGGPEGFVKMLFGQFGIKF